jgi:exonuclease III
MPDASYSDNDVNLVYAQLDEQLRDAHSQRRRCIVCGDMNCQVGTRTDFDDPDILGRNGPYVRNLRGSWLLQWCTLHTLVLANTFFETDPDNMWTYRKGDIRRQLDYILVDKTLFPRLRSCNVLEASDTGSDHRPVVAHLARACLQNRRERRRRRIHGKWHPDKKPV